MPEKTKPLIQSVERALDILEIVRDNGGVSLRATDIANSMGLRLATAHNIIRTLYGRGYLSQDDDGKYLLGPELFALSSHADRWTSFRLKALPILEKLSAATHDLSCLLVEDAGRLVSVAIVEGSGSVVVSPNPALFEQFHSTASGQVILACKSANELKKMKETLRLKKNASSTITNWRDLERILIEIRKNGYSLCRNQSVEGTASIAVPFRMNGRVVGTVGQAYPDFAIDKMDLPERVALLEKAASDIEEVGIDVF